MCYHCTRADVKSCLESAGSHACVSSRRTCPAESWLMIRPANLSGSTPEESIKSAFNKLELQAHQEVAHGKVSRASLQVNVLCCKAAQRNAPRSARRTPPRSVCSADQCHRRLMRQYLGDCGQAHSRMAVQTVGTSSSGDLHHTGGKHCAKRPELGRTRPGWTHAHALARSCDGKLGQVRTECRACANIECYRG